MNGGRGGYQTVVTRSVRYDASSIVVLRILVRLELIHSCQVYTVNRNVGEKREKSR